VGPLVSSAGVPRVVAVACVLAAVVVLVANAFATGTSEAVGSPLLIARPRSAPPPLPAARPRSGPPLPVAPLLPAPPPPTVDPRAVLAPLPSLAPAAPVVAPPVALASAPTAPAPVPRFAGPVTLVADRDLPDPFVLHVGATWWLYATGSGAGNLQVTSSADLIAWGPSSDPLPTLPAWAAPGFTWAPAVLPRGDRFVLYYSVRDAALGRQCISAAVAATPAGPFVDASAGPMICQTTNGGSIDPAPFVDADGTAYLLWKSEDNALGTRTRIGGQRLSDDGLSLVGPRPAVLSATARWEDGVVEGPAMVAVGGRYYLFYGANHWDTPGASIGYAVCAGPLGPCTDQSVSHAWLATQGPIVGPSGPDPFVGADGSVRLAFHAWATAADGSRVRALWIGTVAFGG